MLRPRTQSPEPVPASLRIRSILLCFLLLAAGKGAASFEAADAHRVRQRDAAGGRHLLARSAADADSSIGASGAAASDAAALANTRRAVSRQLGRGGRAFTFAHNYANCSRGCGLQQGAGGCGEAGWCTCAPGHGGPGCGFSASALYGGAAFASSGANLYTHLVGEAAGTGATGGGVGPVSDAAKAWKGATGSGVGSHGGHKHQHQPGAVRHEQLGRLLDWLFGSRLVRPGTDAKTGAGDGDGDKAARPADMPQFVAQVGCHHHSTVEWGRWLWTRVGGGLVLCVDPWLPSWSKSESLAVSVAGHGAAGAASSPGSGAAFRAFLSVVSSLGLQDLVLPMAALPRDAAAALSRLAAAPDVVHVSGAFAGGAGGGRHGYEELTQQMRDWWAVLAPGGVMMIPSGGSVTASLAMGVGGGHGGQPGGSPAASGPLHAATRAESTGRSNSGRRVVDSSNSNSGGGGGGGRMNGTVVEAMEAAVDAAVAAFAIEHEAVPVRVHAHWLLVKAVAANEGAGGGAAVALGVQKRRDGSTVGAPAAGGDAGGGAEADAGGLEAHQGTASAMQQLQKQLQLVQQQVLQLKQQQQQHHSGQEGQQVVQAARGQQGSGPKLLRQELRFVLELGPGGDVRQGGRCNASLEVFPEQLRNCSFGEYLWVSEWNYAVAAFPGSATYVEPGAWGNSLGTYYQGLAIAQLLGLTFKLVDPFPREDWRSYLPVEVPPGLVCPNATEVLRACQLCSGGEAVHRGEIFWEFTHDCPAGWPRARDALRTVTRVAMEAWAAANNRTLPSLDPRDAVIQLRCAEDTLLVHELYGPTAFSMYDKHLPTDVRRVFLAYAHHGHNSPKVVQPCERIVAALKKYIKKIRPRAELIVAGGDQWDDWARMVYAPVVFRDSTSSWGLWSTLAGTGKAFAPPIFATDKDAMTNLKFVTPYVDESYTFEPDAKVLFPAVAKAAGLGCCADPEAARAEGRPCCSEQQVDAIIAWLESN